MTRRTKKIWLILLLGTFGLGLFRGWFALTSAHHKEDSKLDIKLTVDPDKAKSDASQVQQKVKDMTHRATQKGSESPSSADDHKQPDHE